MRPSLLLAAAWLAGPALLSCAPGRSPPWPSATARQWTAMRASLDQQRRVRPSAPWAGGLRITLRDPRSGRVVDGRGAIAVAPGQAVRMVLIGAAGATMLDAWVTRTRWRIAVPPLDLVRRGDVEEPYDMPVAFLRWWFLTPLTGRLLAAAVTRDGPLWVLREGGAIVELRQVPCEHGCLQATRRALGRAETVEECREAVEPRAGDSARYLDEGTGLSVDLRLESIATESPKGEAFEDPDVNASNEKGGT